MAVRTGVKRHNARVTVRSRRQAAGSDANTASGLRGCVLCLPPLHSGGRTKSISRSLGFSSANLQRAWARPPGNRMGKSERPAWGDASLSKVRRLDGWVRCGGRRRQHRAGKPSPRSKPRSRSCIAIPCHAPLFRDLSNYLDA